MVLDQLFPSLEPQEFLQWTLSSFQKSVAELYTIFPQKHLEADVEMLEVGICFTMCSPKLPRVVQ
jgi:hypothetical protein